VFRGDWGQRVRPLSSGALCHD